MKCLLFVKYLGVSSGVALDSARQNLASSFVNSFVNAAFGADKLLTEDGNKWIYKNKEHGMNIETLPGFAVYTVTSDQLLYM